MNGTSGKMAEVIHTPMTMKSHIYATVALGLLCGWYFLILLLVPVLIYLTYMYRLFTTGTILAGLFAMTIVPLDHTPDPAFMYSPWWKPLRDYFSFETDVSSMKFEEGRKYMFMEFPHGASFYTN